MSRDTDDLKKLFVQIDSFLKGSLLPAVNDHAEAINTMSADLHRLSDSVALMGRILEDKFDLSSYQAELDFCYAVIAAIRKSKEILHFLIQWHVYDLDAPRKQALRERFNDAKIFGGDGGQISIKAEG